MKYRINRSADDPTQFQLVLEATTQEEDEVFRSLYPSGGIIALGETTKGKAELVLGPARE
jgi:hypothetical protein